MISTETQTTDKLPSEITLFEWFRQSVRKPAIRTMRQFAEQEFTIPEGKAVNRKFRVRRQPFAGLLLDEYDSGRWRRHAVTGCVQSGKTLMALVVPLLYHLFEVKEDVIIGVPQMELAEDKWKKEFLPAIMATPKFRELLPKRGKGSKGGKFESLQFEHGPSIKFMSGRGGDEKRSAYTSRVVVCTEIDKYDEAAESSREADPVSQMEARTASYGDDARIYLECTVSVPRGRIWQEVKNGSDSRIVSQCPECEEWVTPEKEHFTGFEHAKTETQAGAAAKFVCPACDSDITAHRVKMNLGAKVLHGEQTIDKQGTIHGDAPETKTLGFRWNAFNNLFWSPSYLGEREWNARKSVDEESGEKYSNQFCWATPWMGHEDSIDLTIEDIETRQVATGRGQIPDNTLFTTIAIDVNTAVLHWTAIAWLRDGTGLIVDYGKKATQAGKYGKYSFEVGVARALAWLHENIGAGWTSRNYKAAVVDSKDKPEKVIAAIQALKDKRWFAYMGYGSGQEDKNIYREQQQTSKKKILWVGDGVHEAVNGEKYGSQKIIHADANKWKHELHERFTMPFVDGHSEEGGMQIFQSMDEGEHDNFARHLVSETKATRFVPGKGREIVWEHKRSANHWLDSTYMNLPLAVRLGFKFEKFEEPIPKVQTVYSESRAGFQTPNGQPYMVTEREV